MKALLTFTALLCLSLSPVSAQDADLIVRKAASGRATTRGPGAQAAADRGERLIAVGTNAQVQRAPTVRARA